MTMTIEELRALTIIPIKELQALLLHPGWWHRQELSIARGAQKVAQLPVTDRLSGSLKLPDMLGLATKISVLEGITIKYFEEFYCYEFAPGSIDIGIGDNTPWRIKGARVVDDEGNTLPAKVWAEELGPAFSKLDYRGLRTRKVNNLGILDGDDSPFELECHNAPGLIFSGERIGSVSSTPGRGDHLRFDGGLYTGHPHQSTSLDLYKTASERLVCYVTMHTTAPGKSEVYIGEIFDTFAAAREFFGEGSLAKRLYAVIGEPIN